MLAEGGVPGGGVLHPETIGVAAKQREDLALGEIGAAPGRGRPHRCVNSGGPRQPLERDEVTGLVVELILELDSNDRAVFTDQARELLADRAVPGLNERQVGGIVGPMFDRKLLDPVGEATVAHLTVGPRPNTDHDGEPHLSACLHEGAQIEITLEPVGALFGFVVIPEHVAGHHGDAAGLHQP